MTSGSAGNLAKKYPQRKYYRRLIPERPRLVEAYLYFSEAIKTYLHDDSDNTDDADVPKSDPVEKADDLFQAILHHVQLVAINLEHEDDPQVIFETLNARGVPLEPSDLIRNFIFLFATRKGESAETLYSQWWSKFDDSASGTTKFWSEKERQGRLQLNRFDLFLFHYLVFRLGREIKMGHVFPEFREWWESSPAERSTAMELETLDKFATVFRSLIQPRKDSKFGTFATRLATLDTSTVYPLVFWFAEYRDQVPEADFDAILTDLESYLIRRAVCNLTTKNYNRLFLSLLAKLRAAGPPNQGTFRRELSSLQGDSAKWPIDAEFRRSLVEARLYETLGPRRTNTCLEAIELGLQSSKRESVQITGPLSVEHILPRSAKHGGNAWPLPLVMADGAAYWELVLRRERLTDSLGNITLLTQPLNSAMSNGPFSKKRPELATQSRLTLNSYFQRFSDTDVWDEQAILQRGNLLADVALRIWPGP